MCGHTLLIDLLALLIRRSRIVGIDLTAVARLIHLVGATGILAGNLTTGLVVAERGKLGTHAGRVASAGRGVGGIGGRAVDRSGTTADGGALTFFFRFARVVFLLLASFPFLADFLELCDDGTKEEVISHPVFLLSVVGGT